MGQSQTVLALMRSEAAAAQLSQAYVGVNGTRLSVEVCSCREASAQRFAQPDVLLVEMDPGDTDDVEALRGIICKHWPGTPVVVTARDASIRDVRRLLHLGVADVLPQPPDEGELNGALERIAAAGTSPDGQSVAGSGGGSVISFLKAGGGVGATTMLTQAAHLLATRRDSAPRVCLLDLDIQFGNAAHYLDLRVRSVGLPDLVEAPERLDAALLAGAMSRHASGVDVLAAPDELLALDMLTPEFVESLMRVARQNYGAVLVDLPTDWTPWSYTVLRDSTHVLLTMQYTIGGIHRAARQIETLSNHELADERLQIILNRFDKGVFNGWRLREVEKVLGRKVSACVPNDFAVVIEALNQGIPVSKLKPRHRVVKVLDHLLDEIMPAEGSHGRAAARP